MINVKQLRNESMVKRKDRTEELIEYLQNNHHFTINRNTTDVVCSGGKLMGSPVKVFIIPELGIAKFMVSIRGAIGGCVFSASLNYANSMPIDLMVNKICEKFILAIKEWRFTYE